MKEIVVNVSKDKKIIVVAQDTQLVEKYEELNETQILEGNIYLGKVTDVLLGMQAVFVDIGDEKNAFLHIKDILPKMSNKTGNKNEDLSKYNVKDYIRIGMPVIVEVKKDKTGKKGAKVSTDLNISSKFVAIATNGNFITASQKIEDKDEANRLINIVKEMNIQNVGIIIRTSAIGISKDELKKDVQYIINLYEDIKQKAKKIIAENDFKPTILYEKGSIIKRLLLDIGKQDLKNIFVNEKCIYYNIKNLVQDNKLSTNVVLLERENILDLYGLENQIDKISNRKVWLKCGGFIIIDKTEALTAIDVNTGKFTGKESIKNTVLKVNSEAAIEIAKQIRARNIGGIIVIDFIDMADKADEVLVQELLTENLKKDRAKTQVVGFTKLHLFEMTRKCMYS